MRLTALRVARSIEAGRYADGQGLYLQISKSGVKSWLLRYEYLRRERWMGLTQEALAHDCGINRTYLSSVERAERNVSIDNVARIAGGLKVEAWRLLRDE